MGTEVIADILNDIKTSNKTFFQGIKRVQYLPYDMEIALQVVEAIGKQRKTTFVIDDENRFVYENMIRWVHGDPEFKCIDPETRKIIPGRLNSGIYIAGTTGSGKSWALDIMSLYATIDSGDQNEDGVRVFAGGMWRPLKWPIYRCDSICDEYVEQGTVQKYKKMAIVCFQDFGAEPKESLHMGNRINVMEQVLGYRGDRTDQITLLSSNLPIDSDNLRKRYDDRVASRLNELCNYLILKGQDRRRVK